MKTISEIRVETVIEMLEAALQGANSYNKQNPNNYSQGYIEATMDALKLIKHLKEE